jgi:hypothetical protein
MCQLSAYRTAYLRTSKPTFDHQPHPHQKRAVEKKQIASKDDGNMRKIRRWKTAGLGGHRFFFG